MLLAILASPPLTAGVRTTRRGDTAAGLLGFSESGIANLFALPSLTTNDISVCGDELRGWQAARQELTAGLGVATGVLLAYGIREPSGLARVHFRDQLSWLSSAIAARRLSAWCVG